SLSMAGVPPFNGFYSKEYLYEASLEVVHELPTVGWLFPVVAVVASVFTFVYSIRFFSEVFMGDFVSDEHEFHSPLPSAVAPVGVLVGTMAVISVAPSFVADSVVTAGIEAVYGSGVDFHPHLPTSLTPPFVMSLITIGLGIIVYLRHEYLRDGLRAVFERAPPTKVNYYYDGFLGVSSRLSDATVRHVETGYLRNYVGWILTAMSAMVLAGYF
ncbi:MAG: Na+/H+ antiporter subunit A, partial [Halobacteria archaeon]|nr:Na+/H+ antiporter subunit A [Halobacteria archaeon]